MSKWIYIKDKDEIKCDNCGYTMPGSTHSESKFSNPDDCPRCRAYMENGYGNVLTNLKGKVNIELFRIRDDVIPGGMFIYPQDELAMWQAAFEDFIINQKIGREFP